MSKNLLKPSQADDNRWVCFDKYGPLPTKTESGNLPSDQGIFNIVYMARPMAAYAARISGEATLPQLHSK